MSAKIKLSDKQKEIVKLMREGHPFMTGQSETTGRVYYLVASTHNNGLGNTYLTARVFGNLLDKELIHFSNQSFDYELTELGETIEL